MVAQRWEPDMFVQSRFSVSCAHPLWPGLCCQGVHFQLQDYRDPLYYDYRIAMPMTIQRAVPRRKAEFLAGRLAARQACQSAGVSGAMDIRIGPLRAPVWPQGLVGSISHCYPSIGLGIALAVAGPAQRGLLGVDAELIPDRRYSDMIAESALNTRERAYLGTLSNLEYGVYTTLVFSAKESIFKAYAPVTQAYFEFDAAEVMMLDDTRMLFRLTQPLAPDLPSGLEIVVRWMLLTPDVVLTAVVAHHPAVSVADGSVPSQTTREELATGYPAAALRMKP